VRIDEVFKYVEHIAGELIALEEKQGSMTPTISRGKERRSVTRQFKRYGNKLARQFRCMSGPRKGRLVKNPQKCGLKKDPKQVRAGKKASRYKKGQRVRHTKLAKRRAPTERLQQFNKRLRGASK